MDDVAVPAATLTFSTLMVAVPAHLTRVMSKAGTLQRNRTFGIKTRATLGSDHAWRKGHAAAESWLLARSDCLPDRLIIRARGAASGQLAVSYGSGPSRG